VAASPAPSDLTLGWVPYESPRLGYAVKAPPDWSATDATAPWSYGTTPDYLDVAVWDHLEAPDDSVQLLITSQGLPAGTDSDGWVCRRLELLAEAGDCAVEVHDEIPIGSITGRYGTVPWGFEAAAVSDGRGYYFLLRTSKNRSQFLLFEAFMGNVELRPEKAAD
jgi:hypothetical protein